MVARIDSSKIPVGGPAPKAAPPPTPKPDATPAMPGDGLSLSKQSQTPVLGSSYEIKGGAITTSHTVKIDDEPERVMAAIEGDWSKWWPSGKVSAVPEGTALPKPEADETRFLFQPEGAKGPAYVVRQFVPTAEQAGRGALMMVVAGQLAGDATGDLRFEIRITPDSKTLLTAKWAGVKPAKGQNAEALAQTHLAAEKRAFEQLGTWLKANP